MVDEAEEGEQEESNYEAVKADVVDELDGVDFGGTLPDKSKLTPAALLERIALLIEAQGEDINEGIAAVYDEATGLKLEVSHSLNRHAAKIIKGYAAWAVALGLHTGTIDEDGDPTDKMPEELKAALLNLNANLHQFLEVYAEQVPEEPDAPVVVAAPGQGG